MFVFGPPALTIPAVRKTLHWASGICDCFRRYCRITECRGLSGQIQVGSRPEAEENVVVDEDLQFMGASSTGD